LTAITSIAWSRTDAEIRGFKKPTGGNDLSYPEINSMKLMPVSDFVLVAWDLCQDEIKVGKHTLIRPETHKKMHYVGTVIACGPDVDDVIQPGQRIVFDQFSNFEKYWDPEIGRVALVQESKQGSLFAIVPKRIKVEGSESEYNYDV
jgi:co-chaperonin GroES (HSP10)